jgi:hypothetical protein
VFRVFRGAEPIRLNAFCRAFSYFRVFRVFRGALVPWFRVFRGAEPIRLNRGYGAYSGTCYRTDSGSRVILKGNLSLDLQAEDFVEILAQGRIEPIVDRVFCRD